MGIAFLTESDFWICSLLILLGFITKIKTNLNYDIPKLRLFWTQVTQNHNTGDDNYISGTQSCSITSSSEPQVLNNKYLTLAWDALKS